MSPPSSPTRTPSTAGGLRRGEGLRLLRWPTAPLSSMGSIRFRSGGAAREAAAGTLGSIRSFPSVAPKARIWRTFLAQFYDVLAPAEGLHPTSSDSCTVFGFCYLLVWGYIADLSMVPRLRRGRLAGRALSHPFILRGHNAILRRQIVRPVGRCLPAACTLVPQCASQTASDWLLALSRLCLHSLARMGSQEGPRTFSGQRRCLSLGPANLVVSCHQCGTSAASRHRQL